MRPEFLEYDDEKWEGKVVDFNAPELEEEEDLDISEMTMVIRTIQNYLIDLSEAIKLFQELHGTKAN